MKAVKVQYTVKPEFVETNKKNVNKVMTQLKQNPIEGMKYATFQLEDEQTFVHLNFARDEKTMAKLQDLPEFKVFRAALKDSAPITPPKSEKLTLVDAGYDII